MRYLACRQRLIACFYKSVRCPKQIQQTFLTKASRRQKTFTERDFSTSMFGRNSRPWRAAGAPEFKEDVELYSSTSVVETDVLLVGSIEDSRQTDSVQHHTNDFDQSKYFVVRRGQDFNLKILLKRPYDPAKDDLNLTFQFGDEPNPFDGTHIRLEPNGSEQGWISNLKSVTEESIEFTINANAKTCAVGPWKVSVDTKLTHSKKTYRFTYEEPVRILFNPWCKDDTVYMGDENGDPLETELNEYVLNDMGCIYINKDKYGGDRKWRFGQFDNIVLETAEYLLEKEGRSAWQPKKIPPLVRGNPIFVSRKLSALINGNDDDGVIYGNWSGSYEGGTNPGNWKGSVKILEEYMKPRKENPEKDAETVKYGQCWVFSGLATTLCRALGIPARSVTNFASAHDKDETSDINMYLNDDWDFIRGDSVWNFHVWNEVYFRRPDLSTNHKYDGWQVIDATPQERSDGAMQLGPAPLLAIKNGNVTKNYDSRFVFAEVNGDVYYWIINEDRKIEFLDVTESMVGQMISTKKVGVFEREILTDFYKYPEGTEENKKAVDKAKALSERNREWDKHKKIEVPTKDVKAKVNLNQETVIGGTVELVVEFNNTSGEERTITEGSVHVVTQFYTNQTYKKVKVIETGEIKLQPNEKIQKPFTVLFDEYYPKLTDFNIIGVNLSCMVVQTGHHVTDFERMTLQKPKLKIIAPTQIKRNQNFQVEISFTNPLDMQLTNCLLTFEGSGFFNFKLSQSNLSPRAKYLLSFEQICRKIGKKSMMVSFDSDELLAIENVHEIIVEE